MNRHYVGKYMCRWEMKGKQNRYRALHDLSEERNRRLRWPFLTLRHTPKEEHAKEIIKTFKAKKKQKISTTNEGKNEKATKQQCQTKTNSKVRNGVFYDVYDSNCS